MVQIKEFRIVMPMTVEEYGMGLTYTVMKMEQQNTNSKEGVEILQNSPFEDQMLGKGQYTSKVYHLQRCSQMNIRWCFIRFVSTGHDNVQIGDDGCSDLGYS
ncbi:Phosphatidylinositol transfer protein alpha isoform [Ananas comosus]|uniref:Phosphatidylinositol transfer protein alpha isoform n=1 Tax=Ananas comosus TaxID=4615 RepID=A0A199VB51_ANACO|nr:Phosphatidylinositol transfer protein alpha isoform [Ananas comosus]